MSFAYLDYNATAPLYPQVTEIMTEVMASPNNPSSGHRRGRAAKKHVEDARTIIAERLSCFPAEIIFTGCGTEANHLALSSRRDWPVLVSATEHASVLNATDAPWLIPVDGNGVLKLDELEKKLKEQASPCLVSVMLANNETGVIQPVREIAALVHAYDGLLHSDAIQAFGKIPVDIGLLGVDMLSVSAHKMGGPQGVAALVVRQGIDIQPMLRGGGQEGRRRAGTENVAAIAGFAGAVKVSAEADWQNDIRDALDRMESSLEGAEIPGKAVKRLPNTSAIIMPGVPSETQLIHFDLEGYAVSAGSACSSGRVEPSHVAQAMGYSKAEAATMLRISAGWGTRQEEIERFAEDWLSLAKRMQQKSA